MNFCFNINLKPFNIDSSEDWWHLTDLFDDVTLSTFIEDNQYAKYIYFIREQNQIIGFVYLLQYRDTEVLNLEYGIMRKYLNDDYVYTVLTLVRDKIKGVSGTKELKENVIVTSLLKEETRYNQIASKFGSLLYSDDFNNYYEVNPNCENIEHEKVKVLNFLTNRTLKK